MSGEHMPSPFATEEKKSITLSEAMEVVKDGKLDALASQFLQSFRIEGDNREAFITQFSEKEGVSTKFAERFLDDESFRRRVINICNNFSQHGERLLHMEEAEIYTEIMEPNTNDVAPLLQSTNPSERFKGARTLPRNELIAKRLLDMRDTVLSIGDTEMTEKITYMIESAMKPLGLGDIVDDASWRKMAESEELLSAFVEDATMRDLYKQATEGQELEQIGRRIQLYRHERNDGSVVPTLGVDQVAKNMETGAETRLGFMIEREQDKRVLKDILVMVDKNTRNSNEGMKFLLDNLPLVKKYELSEAEFVANLKIGSYVWARIADVDAGAMAEDLSTEAQKELGPNADPKHLKAKVFEELILPAYERNFRTAHDTALHGKDLEPALEKAFSDLRAKALAGEATMEDFARLGEGKDMVKFDAAGKIVESDSSEAMLSGHLGKAAIMGIPWKARVPLDRSSLFDLIDKLDKSKGLMPLLKRTGQKIGLALSL
ncbi:MAG: hypothetical protein WCK01_03420 [Candidatus Uhrbacteria bacterium]